MSFLYQALTREECETIREEDGYVRGLAEGRQEGLLMGSFKTLEKLVQSNILSLQQAAEQMGAQGVQFTLPLQYGPVPGLQNCS